MGKNRAQPVQLVSHATRWRMRAMFLCALLAGMLLALGFISSFWQFGVVWITPNPHGPGNALHSVSLDRGNWVTSELSISAGWHSVETGFRVVAPGAPFWSASQVTPNGWRSSGSVTAVEIGVLLCIVAAFLLLLGIGRRANDIPAGSCGICGYDLRGAASDKDVCPECGNPMRNVMNRGT